MTMYLQVSETEKQLEEERGAGETARAEAQSLKADLGAVRDSLAAASQQLASERDASACPFLATALFPAAATARASHFHRRVGVCRLGKRCPVRVCAALLPAAHQIGDGFAAQ